MTFASLIKEQTKNMDQHERGKFRKELKRVIPDAVKEAAKRALEESKNGTQKKSETKPD